MGGMEMAEKLKPSVCHKCGVPRVDNPHPDAGKPDRMLEVGCPQECLPCTVLSRHQWAQRAYAAEKRIRELESALESRASNAGGAVAWSVTNDGGRSISSVLFADYYDAADHARRCGGTTKPIRVYTHPAPASKEPVVDERAAEYRNEWNPLLECYERVRVHDVQQLIAEDDRAALATAQTEMTREQFAVFRDVVDDLECELQTRYQGYAEDDRRRVRDFAVVKRARALLASAQTPEGWKLVPVEPTDKMTLTGQKVRYNAAWSIGAIYREMLAAAPAKPEGV